ncbi:MAG: hypothetical protein WCE79_03675 [Xanthobacteraceae bacterium]
MPTINGRFYSSFGSYSGYQQLQIERAQNTAARQQAESDASALGDVLSGASQDLAQGLANLAAQAALARINNEASAKQATSGASTDSPDTSDTLAPTEDPVIAVDAAMHGITDLLPENVPSTDDTATDDLDVATSVNRIVDGTADLLDSSDTSGSSSDGSDLFATLDSIINSFVPPLPPSVDVTA